jgi:hypothetical protein
MSDFSSGIKSNLNVNKKSLLNRKIDFSREKFVKGISSTKFGQKEDPTYLHFKFVFDLGISGIIDPETFLAPSPLFKKMDSASPRELAAYEQRLGAESAARNGGAPKVPSPGDFVDAGHFQSGKFVADTDFFYGTKFKVNGLLENRGAFPFTGGIAYVGAQEFLSIRSLKRSLMIKGFRNGLDYINKNCPYYFQSISGLDQLLKTPISNYHKNSTALKRAGTLTIECLESIDMRLSALAELYRKAIYDYTNHRIMLPENLRKFRMWLVVTEIRNIQLQQGTLGDVLNPFSIPSVAKIAGALDSFNSQTGLVDKALGKSGDGGSDGSDGSGPDTAAYDMMPYVWIYQFDQCEFDFDETYPFGTSIDNKGGSAVTTKFSIHVGRVKDHKIQFNQLADFMGKNDGIASMVINDTWNPKAPDGYDKMDYEGSDGLDQIEFSDGKSPGAYFARLASNFVTNSVADLKNQGVAMLEGKLLGNVYGLGGIDPGAALSSVQSIISTAKSGIPNPFQKNDPQSKGLGGPGERQYPTIKADVYPTVGGQGPGGSLGNVLGGSNNPSNLPAEDVYPASTPAYPVNNEDEQPDVPGTDLGVPLRVYNTPNDDVYPTVPSTPAYPVNTDDAYNDVPGSDLGAPGRVYNTPNDDVYPTVPSTPVYLPSPGDVYNNVPGTDLGVPGRVYTPSDGDVYPTVPSTPAYPNVVEDEYTTSKGTDLGVPGRVYPNVAEDEYPTVPSTPAYPNVAEDEYLNSKGPDLGVPDRLYKEPLDDAYPTVPSATVYPPVIGDEYLDSKGPDLGVPDRLYKEPEPQKDVYPTVPSTPAYPPVTGDEYRFSEGPDLGVPGRVYPDVYEDKYTNTPGPDLGLPSRKYPTLSTDEYKDSKGKDLGVPGRAYESINDSVYTRANKANGISTQGGLGSSVSSTNSSSVGSTEGNISSSVPGKETLSKNKEYIASKPADTKYIQKIYPRGGNTNQ